MRHSSYEISIANTATGTANTGAGQANTVMGQADTTKGTNGHINVRHLKNKCHATHTV